MEAPPDQVQSESPDSTSLSLLERVKARDQEAWRRLVQIYGPLVYHWCRRFSLGAEDMADIFQEVFRSVAAQIGGFRNDRPRDSFRGWLWTITRNKVNDHFRRKDDQAAAVGGSTALQQLLALPQPPDDDEPAESDSIVHRALDLIRAEFEERTWTAFWRVTVEGHAPKDIAAELGVTPDAVRMAKCRVLRRLRQELA